MTLGQSKIRDRQRRIAWWQQARFGMFVHWGLYSQIGRHEWVMNRERIPIAEYEKFADTWKPAPRPMREWARLAKAAGMKYMVMTTKHHEGFCLWDSKITDYNAMQHGPHRDLVREYVEACREFGLKIGFYYSLMDWHHPDGARCALNEPARQRFCKFTQALVRELMTNYGKIDILWYDVPCPLNTPVRWESRKMNAMARRLQPDILINNRSQLPEDFGTPEEHIKPEPEKDGRGWEACMTYNHSWGYMPSAIDWRSNREVIGMLNTCSATKGNLLLNIGPKPDGSVPAEAVERLQVIGKWIATHGEAMYGAVESMTTTQSEWMPTGGWNPWSMKNGGRTVYYWCKHWPGDGQIVIAGLRTKVKRITNLTLRRPVKFTQTGQRLVMTGLPRACPDKLCGVTIFKLECATKFRHVLGAVCVVLPKGKTT
ncbi:MAG: alpha-L-fucosidase [Verrucomicrobiota bacterium]